MMVWILAGVVQLLVLALIVIGPYIGLYGREDQRRR